MEKVGCDQKQCQVGFFGVSNVDFTERIYHKIYVYYRWMLQHDQCSLVIYLCVVCQTPSRAASVTPQVYCSLPACCPEICMNVLCVMQGMLEILYHMSWNVEYICFDSINLKLSANISKSIQSIVGIIVKDFVPLATLRLKFLFISCYKRFCNTVLLKSFLYLLLMYLYIQYCIYSLIHLFTELFMYKFV